MFPVTLNPSLKTPAAPVMLPVVDITLLELTLPVALKLAVVTVLAVMFIYELKSAILVFRYPALYIRHVVPL
jgi:hypothetical protein